MSNLYKMLKGIDDNPFSGKREIEPTKVICRGKSIPDNAFNSDSLYGNSRAKYYQMLTSKGITPEKEYTAIGVEGYGDVFDVIIEANDTGEEAGFMEICFEAAPPQPEFTKGE